MMPKRQVKIRCAGINLKNKEKPRISFVYRYLHIFFFYAIRLENLKDAC